MPPRLAQTESFVPSNGYKGQMSADAAGIMVCLFTFSLLSFEYPRGGGFQSSFLLAAGLRAGASGGHPDIRGDRLTVGEASVLAAMLPGLVPRFGAAEK
jgi:hypothetical protein